MNRPLAQKTDAVKAAAANRAWRRTMRAIGHGFIETGRPEEVASDTFRDYAIAIRANEPPRTDLARQQCRHPNCNVMVSHDAITGCCMQHRHTKYCVCLRCEERRAQC